MRRLGREAASEKPAARRKGLHPAAFPLRRPLRCRSSLNEERAMPRLFGALSGAVFLAGAMALPAAAQETAPDEVIYEARFFAEYAPQSALDMVRRTPGFTLDEGENVRGFGGAAGNVLIDGARPPVKGDGLSDFLARIPSGQVAEVRLIRNAQTAEAQGQALILNIIRRPVEASSAWSLGIEQTGEGSPAPFGSLSFVGVAAGFEGAFEIEIVTDQTPFRTRRAFSSPDGSVLANWSESRIEDFERVGFSGDASRTLWGGVLGLAGAARLDRSAQSRESRLYFARPAEGSPDGFAPFAEAEEEYGFSLGADFSRRFGAAETRLVALLTWETETEEQRDSRRDAGFGLLRRLTSVAEREAWEAVVRGSAAWELGEAWRVETAAEAAFNRLNSELSVTEDEGSGPMPIVIPGAAAVVGESRGEVLFAIVYAPPGRLRIDGALGGESSHIAVSGDAQNSQDFVFLKPRASIAYDLGGGASVNLSAERRIGQLDFGDFAASARLSDGVATAGNPALGPDTALVYRLDFDWRGENGLALTVEASHEVREGVLEQVSLPTGGVGVANAGAATAAALRVSLDWPMDGLIAGGKLSLSGESNDSVFSDPLTRADRLLTDFSPSSIEASFRHDPPGMPFSWGVEWRGSSRQISYRIDLTDERASEAQLSAFAETTLWGLRSRLELRNLGGSGFRRERRNFLPDRAGALSGIERRWTTYGTVASWEIAGRF